MKKKHVPNKIVLERKNHERTTVRPSGGMDLWSTATRILRGWGEYSETTFEVHYDDGEVFVGHITLGDPLDIATHMRHFCEFYALRRVPILYLNDQARFARHIQTAYYRQHAASIRWLDQYEIGPQDEEQTKPSLPSFRAVDDDLSAMTPAPMTPSWT